MEKVMKKNERCGNCRCETIKPINIIKPNKKPKKSDDDKKEKMSEEESLADALDKAFEHLYKNE